VMEAIVCSYSEMKCHRIMVGTNVFLVLTFVGFCWP